MDPQEIREMENRRLSAQGALNSIVECIRQTSPTSIFGASAAKDKSLFESDNALLQRVNQQYFQQVGDVLSKAMQLSLAIGDDALSMFRPDTQENVSRAKRSRTPEAES